MGVPFQGEFRTLLARVLEQVWLEVSVGKSHPVKRNGIGNPFTVAAMFSLTALRAWFLLLFECQLYLKT